MTKAAIVNNWYWAAAGDRPAGDLFVIENGMEGFWERARREIGNEHFAWSPIHPKSLYPRIEDILDMLLTVVPAYHVRHNRFMFEAGKIPVFARFLRAGRADLCNYVSNPVFEDAGAERYDEAHTQKLGNIANSILGVSDVWF